MARREERAYRKYVSDEQRSQPRGPQRGSRVGVEEDAPPGNYVTNHCYGTLAWLGQARRWSAEINGSVHRSS